LHSTAEYDSNTVNDFLCPFIYILQPVNLSEEKESTVCLDIGEAQLLHNKEHQLLNFWCISNVVNQSINLSTDSPLRMSLLDA
jgi:hypothetical protein